MIAILERGNDLQEFFWPVIYFVKNHLLTDKTLPLWNNLILSGTPLLPDPQAPLFYPLNIFALFMQLDFFFIFSFILHTFIGGVGFYFCSKEGFKFSKKTSVFLALLYLTAPKLAGYLEAGHVGLVYSFAWVPFCLWAATSLRRKPKIKYSFLLGVGLAFLFFCHLPTFLIMAVFCGILALTKKSIPHLLISLAIVSSLTAVSLLPQLAWQKHSTRYLLLQDKDVYPKWNSIVEPVKNAVIPWLGGKESLQAIDTEKWLTLGIIPTLLAIVGFLKLKTKQKIIVAAAATTVFLIILNNASPIYPLLLKQKWYLLMRVSTRFWILVVLLTLFLTGLALEKSKSKLLNFLALLAIVESATLGWLYLNKPITQKELAPKEVYEFLAGDAGRFRVYCLTRCLSQKQAAVYNLELIDGYNTVIQKNYNSHALQLTGAYWNYYTLSVPPIGSYLNEKLTPNIKSLGQYNTKYLISPYEVKDAGLKMVKRIDKYLIYEIKSFAPRNYEIYTPNFIRVRVMGNPHPTSIIIPEVYSPGWKAFLNGTTAMLIQETPESLRSVDIKPDTEFVDFKYQFYFKIK